MNRTYGELRLLGGEMWGVRAEPHVAIRAKRLFARAMQDRAGVIMLKATPEVSRDLEWFASRWPLRMDELTAGHLAEQAGAHRQSERAVGDILAGQRSFSEGLRDPAIPARPYQQQAADVVLATGRLLLADDVGLGKTLSGSLVLRDPSALPALVVTLTHLPWQWQAELAKFLPWLRVHVVTKGQPYNPATRRGSGGVSPDVLVMGYSKLAGWADHLAGVVRTVIFDEIQELRRGEETMKGRAACMVADKAAYRIGLSATPVFNYGGEIHNIMQALAPDALGTRSEFVREWGAADYGSKGVMVREPAALGTYLRDQGLMLRRTRKDVHRELPDPIEIEQPVDTDHATIDQVAADIAHTARILLGDAEATSTERFHAAGEVDWRMRQATGLAKAPYVAEFAKLILESEDRIVLFGWHRNCYDIWLDKLAEYHPVLYTGTESPQQKARSAEAFKGGQSRVLIMSLRSGAGLDGLQDWCSVAVFGELDWSPEIHRQCLGRLARDGQEATCVAYYMVSDDGTDPLMAEVLGIKKQQAEPIRDPGVPLFTTLTPVTDRARTIAADVLRRAAKRGVPEPAGTQLTLMPPITDQEVTP
jgi:SNF2 family DNA or RNA helicase